MTQEVPPSGPRRTAATWHRIVDRVLFALIAAALVSFFAACLLDKGMSALLMAAAGAIFGLIFTNAGRLFGGYGGGLGTTALLSVVMTYGLIKAAEAFRAVPAAWDHRPR